MFNRIISTPHPDRRKSIRRAEDVAHYRMRMMWHGLFVSFMLVLLAELVVAYLMFFNIAHVLRPVL